MIENISKKVISSCSKIASELAFSSFAHFSHWDPRISRRTLQVAEALYSCPGTKFAQVFKTPSDRKAAYRLIENDSLVPEDLISSICKSSMDSQKFLNCQTILIPQDTSTVSTKDFEDVGLIGPKGSSGFFFHSALGLTMEGIPLGLLSMKIFTRSKEPKQSSRECDHLPIEEKESYRWLEAAKEIVPQLPPKTQAIFISDRESDIHEYFACLIDLETSFVVRHSHDRRTVNEEGELGKVREDLSQSPILGEMEISVQNGSKQKFSPKKAFLQWKKLTFQLRPGGLAIHKKRKPVSLTALRIFEKAPNPGTKSIEWILYTNLPINSLQDAKEIVRIYTCRWRIEEFHMTLKTGMRVEKNYFQSGQNIQRLLAISVPMAVKLMELQYKSRESPDILASKILSQLECKAVKIVAKMQTGKIPKKLTLNQAVSHIARLGGWMGRKGDGRPGVRTMWEGWRQIQFLVRVMEEL